MSGLGKIGQNDNFWVKMDKFWSKKGHKKGEKDFCQNFHWVILVIDHGSSFNMQNQQNPMNGLGEIGQNVNFWVKMDTFWPKQGQKGAKKIFVKTFTR